MILCTNCGTNNPDQAHECANCRRKLQSRRSFGAPAQNGSGPEAAPAEKPWVALPTLLKGMDEHAARMVKATAEIWTYAALLVAAALATAWTGDWRYAAAGMVLAAGLAKLRGV